MPSALSASSFTFIVRGIETIIRVISIDSPHVIISDIKLYRISFDVKSFPWYPPAPCLPNHPNQKRAIALLRDLPASLADKIKVASTLHRSSMKDYIQEILLKHIEDLERKGGC